LIPSDQWRQHRLLLQLRSPILLRETPPVIAIAKQNRTEHPQGLEPGGLPEERGEGEGEGSAGLVPNAVFVGGQDLESQQEGTQDDKAQQAFHDEILTA